MRLIDRDTLNEMLSALLEKIGGENITWDDAMATIDHADDVDSVPVIRCKDCKYYDGKWCKLHAISDFDLNDVMKSADDFCSYAERKEE